MGQEKRTNIKNIIRKVGGSGEGGGFSKAAFHSERYSQLTKHTVFLTNHPAVCLTKHKICMTKHTVFLTKHTAVCLTKTNLNYEAHSLPNHVTLKNTQTQSPPDYQINASQ